MDFQQSELETLLYPPTEIKSASTLWQHLDKDLPDDNTNIDVVTDSNTDDSKRTRLQTGKIKYRNVATLLQDSSHPHLTEPQPSVSEPKAVDIEIDDDGDEDDNDEQGLTIEIDTQPSENSEGNASEEDNETYCICNGPDDGTMMLMCDSCQNWFHTKCIGMSKAQAKRMQDNNVDYICKQCQENQGITPETTKITKKKKPANRRKRGTSKASSDRVKRRKTASPVFKSPPPSDDSDIEINGEPDDDDYKPDHKIGSITTKKFYKNAGALCKRCKQQPRQKGNEYCSEECETKAAEEALQDLLAQPAGTKPQIKPEPTTFKPTTHIRRSSSDSKGGGIRTSCRDALSDILAKRASSSDVFKDADTLTLASEIEKALFHYFKNQTDSRYRNKMRRITFNLKDRANEDLFQSVMKGEITPEQLAAMDPKKMANKHVLAHREQLKKSFVKKNLLLRDDDRKVVVVNKNKPDLAEEVNRELGLVDDGDDVFASKGADTNETEEFDSPSKNDVSVSRKNSILSETSEADTSVVTDDVNEIDTPTRELPQDANIETRRNSDLSSVVEQNELPLTIDVDVNKSPTESAQASPSISTISSRIPSNIKLTANDITFSANVLSKKKTSKSSTSSTPPRSTTPVDDFPDALGDDDNEANSTKSPVDSPPMDVDLDEDDGNKDPTVVWKGKVGMLGVAEVKLKAKYAITPPEAGNSKDGSDLLGFSLEIQGRIKPKQVWDYLNKVHGSSSRHLRVLAMTAASSSQEINFVTLFEYFNSRNRFGVVPKSTSYIKDLYFIPWPSGSEIPSNIGILGLGKIENRTAEEDTLLAVAVCHGGVKTPAPIEEPYIPGEIVVDPTTSSTSNTDKGGDVYQPGMDVDIPDEEEPYIPGGTFSTASPPSHAPPVPPPPASNQPQPLPGSISNSAIAPSALQTVEKLDLESISSLLGMLNNSRQQPVPGVPPEPSTSWQNHSSGHASQYPPSQQTGYGHYGSSSSSRDDRRPYSTNYGYQPQPSSSFERRDYGRRQPPPPRRSGEGRYRKRF